METYFSALSLLTAGNSFDCASARFDYIRRVKPPATLWQSNRGKNKSIDSTANVPLSSQNVSLPEG
jgi:hypothetical protein